MLYQNKVRGFLSWVPLALPIPLLNSLSHLLLFPLFFRTLPLLNHLKSHHYDPKQQEFKIQTNKVPWLVPILTAMFISNRILILPLITIWNEESFWFALLKPIFVNEDNIWLLFALAYFHHHIFFALCIVSKRVSDELVNVYKWFHYLDV
jgi:hypothetical protein